MLLNVQFDFTMYGMPEFARTYGHTQSVVRFSSAVRLGRKCDKIEKLLKTCCVAAATSLIPGVFRVKFNLYIYKKTVSNKDSFSIAFPKISIKDGETPEVAKGETETNMHYLDSKLILFFDCLSNLSKLGQN